MGAVHYCRESFWPHNTTLYVTDFCGNDPLFAYFALRNINFRRFDSGSVQAQLNRNNLKSIQVWCPPLPHQRAIAQFLGTLGDKIELNRRTNETLEAMARALFKSWFVDFDPVRAKAAGKQPAGMDAATAALFPSEFVESEIGEIPKGWGPSPITEHFEATKGVSYKGSGLADAGMRLHNLNSILEGGGYKYSGLKHYTGEFAERHRVSAEDVIVANTEQGHDRLLIGYAAMIPARLTNNGIVSHHVYKLRHRDASPLSPQFLCCLLNSPMMHDTVSGYANGTTVNMLPIDGVQRPLIVVPPAQLVAIFSHFSTNQLTRSDHLVVEADDLAKARDALLPRLLSGELRIPDAERFVSDAT